MLNNDMGEPQTIVVPERTPPQRLDVFITQHTTLSRTQAQKHLKAGTIKLNAQPAKPHHQVKPGDIISLESVDTEIVDRTKTNELHAPHVLFEDDNYLVIEKPAGLLVHGAPGTHEPTVADWAVEHAASIKEVGDQPELRPGIVHRLDRDVSGVMVVAKSQAAFADLKQQFQNHSVTKEYIALAYGRIVDQSGRITFSIARKQDKSGLMVARPNSQEGRQAETRFEVDRFVKNLTLVKIRTLTGRSHQIRVHFKAIGYPLVGDPLYKIKRLRPTKIPIKRIFLHASRLEFDDLSGQRRQFISPLPAELQQFLARAS